MSEKDVDDATGIATTGHEWDGIKELDNPLPRWWLYTMYATIVFAIGYMIWFPAIPLWEEATPGISGRSTRGDLNAELALVQEGKAVIEAKIAETDLEAIRADQELFRYATAGGESFYKVFCTQCHGSGAQGAPGYPNLNDDDWIWGGDLEALYTTIAHGVRNDVDDDARFTEMPNFGEFLSGSEIKAIAHHVRQLSKQDHDATLATAGAELFGDNCAACHADTGRGDREQGAPNLSDTLWLYGGSTDQIAQQIANPKHGVMPPWLGKLGEAKVKQLAIYVHSLGGGEKELED